MATTENTVKPGLTRKRAKRQVENREFDAFVRRILAAYGRRIAAGDIEALRSLSMLAGEVDAVTRIAVAGLKNGPDHYSWSEIADRLGVSRQAAQMRYGDRTDRGALDRRLVAAGLSVSVATLVAVFAEHHPGKPASSVCPGCGYRYRDGQTDCPSNQVARPLLYRRRNEDSQALGLLTYDQRTDLYDRKIARANKAAAVPASPAGQHGTDQSLLDLIGEEDTR